MLGKGFWKKLDMRRRGRWAAEGESLLAAYIAAMRRHLCWQRGEAKIEIAVQDQSIDNPGMCKGCAETAPEFAENNPLFDVSIYHGSEGTSP